MKTPVLAVVVMVAVAASTQAGPSSPNQFAAPAMRQDLTGQGTYHRLGLLREQERAVRQMQRAEETRKPRGESWVVRVWRSIFPPRNSTQKKS